MQTERELRQQIVEVGRRIYELGFVAASDGNVSARLADGTILTTPTMVCKGRMTEDMIVLVDIDGNKRRRDERNPSSEFSMHKMIYQLRPDVHAVVHAHPPFGTGFAVANVPLDKPLLSEVILTLGCVPLTGYGTPSTEELPQSLAPFIPHHDALLLANHGAVAYGPDLDLAFARHGDARALCEDHAGRSNGRASTRAATGGDRKTAGRARARRLHVSRCSRLSGVRVLAGTRVDVRGRERHSLLRHEWR